MEDMRGLLLVEGEDIEPRRYEHEKANLHYLEKTHALKDEIEIRLARHALLHDLPILGICRGSQLLNVIRGGTLYGDVQKRKTIRAQAHQLRRALRRISPRRQHCSRHAACEMVSASHIAGE